MIRCFSYDLWNGKEVIGCYRSLMPIRGDLLEVRTVSAFKEVYNKKYEIIKVPVLWRTVYEDEVEIRKRRVLDVRRKSKRQIGIILKAPAY